ncbi:acylneuraminate cytidylyltransferase [Puniceicoccaceae bacterium K14]|nr:acylneuraminate cytidylyltransferase [Puniceicoccaceae bacterium K14]
MTSQVLAVIPARGGSKGLTRKNLRPLEGHPLIAYSIKAALDSKLVSRVICTTDDEEIATVAKAYGAEVPFIRPAHLAQDNTLDLPVFQHIVNWLLENEGWAPDIVTQLRPTSPIRPISVIDRSIEMLASNSAATSVRGVVPAPSNPYKMWRLDQGDFMSQLLEVPGIKEPYNSPRQSLPQAWWQTGTVDTMRTRVLMDGNGSMTGENVLPLQIDGDYAIDIDDSQSLLKAAECLDKLECIRFSENFDWSKVKLLALDVDGTLTPGTMYYTEEGEHLKRFHTHDAHGISLVKSIGISTTIITAEATGFTAARMKKIGVESINIGVKDKVAILKEECSKRNLSVSEVAYVGDDFGDIPVMEFINANGGITCAVSNARPKVLNTAKITTPNKGGEGAVRDVCEWILNSMNKL